jgi:hypothetical protein
VFRDVPSFAEAARDTARAEDHEGAQLSLRELGGVASLDPVPVGVVAFVDHRLADGPVELSPIDALIRLVAETLDLERAAIPGFGDLVSLVRHARCLALPTSDLVAAASQLERERATTSAATLERAERGAVEEPGLLPTAPSADPAVGPELVAADSVLLRRADVHGWALPGGGVVHDFRAGATIQVDAVGFAAWSAFDGSSSVREIAGALAAPGEDAVEELVAFARHLATLGVVTLAG